MSSNVAIVARINGLRKHPNADRLQIANILGMSVIVGMDTQDQELGIFFNSELQLSIEFATANNLVRIKNEDGTYSGGMFNENRRVKAINLRGVKSDGFWCPLSYLDFIVSTDKVQTLVEGYTFTEFAGIPICNKYVTEQTQKAIANRAQFNVKRESPVIDFPQHIDTDQYRYRKNEIAPDSLVIITEKLHGTSGRYGNVLHKRKLSWVERIAKYIGVKVQETEYKHVNGTRRVIMGDVHAGYYGNESFRYNATNGIALRENEIIYFELVGYTTEGKTIMADQDTAKMDKDLVKRYDKVMRYAYGCAPSQCALYAYRITMNGVELSWFEVVKRCKELGINHVPVLDTVYHATITYLDVLVNEHTSGVSTVDSTHIREGVVIRAESEHGMLVLKEKSIDFKIGEGIIKDNPNAEPDIEESA